MIRPPFLLSGFVALLLAAIVAAELAPRMQGSNRTTAAASPPPPTPPARSVAPDRPAEWLDTTLARPLFSPDRRPLPDPGVAADTTLPRLAGIVISPSGSAAIFSLHGAAGLIVVGVGGTVGSWKVTSIDPDEVTIERARLVRVLQTSFDRGPRAPLAGASAQASNPPDAELPAITRLLHHEPQ